MNKTKRTLIVSSVVMTLILVVTAVSVTAAWFTNVADSNEDGFTIDSALLQESASIDIDNTASDYGTAIWPAIANPGYLAKGNLAPYGKDLTQQDDTKITVKAKCAVLYFPINFVGTSDSGATDGRKSLVLSVISAHLGTVEEGIVSEETKDYLSAFNVEMSLVNLVEKEGSDKPVAEPIASVNPSKFANNPSAIYYNQPYFDGDTKMPCYKLYMLVKPGEKYYVKATIYFNQIDEECDENLIYLDEAKKSIVFKFEIKDKVDSNVDIREGNMPA